MLESSCIRLKHLFLINQCAQPYFEFIFLLQVE
jgi:hypothetical protein